MLEAPIFCHMTNSYKTMHGHNGLFVNLAVGTAAYLGGTLYNKSHRLQTALEIAIDVSNDRIENYHHDPTIVYADFFHEICTLAGVNK